MNMKNTFAFVLCVLTTLGATSAVAAVKTSKQAAIQSGTNVRTRLTATGLYDQECYDAYYSCMDQFCITENASGGSCACSDDNAKYEQQLTEIQDMVNVGARFRTE